MMCKYISEYIILYYIIIIYKFIYKTKSIKQKQRKVRYIMKAI